MGRPRVKKEVRWCVVCDKRIERPPWGYKTIPEKTTCSNECKYILKRKKQEVRSCVVCGKKIEKLPNQYGSTPDRTFCSYKCRGFGLRKTEVRHCVNCGKRIERSPSNYSVPPERTFCTKKCYRINLRKKREIRYCVQCGKRMEKPSCNYGASLDSTFCSHKCSANSRKKLLEVRHCAVCGKRVKRRPSRCYRPPERTFCSRKCRGLADRSPTWPNEKGLKWRKNKDGYVYGRWHEHPLANNSSRVFQHRHNFWMALGQTPRLTKMLKNGWQVHHKGAKDDNRPCMLEVRRTGKHPGQSLEDMADTLSFFGYQIQTPLWAMEPEST